MRNTILVFLLVLEIFLTNCSTSINSSSVSSATSFVDDTDIDTINVELSRFVLDESPLCPMSCFFAGDNFVVQEDIGKQKTDLFKIYHNQKLISKFGAIGQSVDEFKYPFLYDQSIFEDSSFWVGDLDKFVQIFLTTDGIVAHKKVVNFPDEIVPVNQIVGYKDSVISFRRTDEYQLSFYDMLSKQLIGYNFFEKPMAIDNVDDFVLNMNLFRCSYGFYNDYIVLAYNNFKIIDIVSASQQKLLKKLYFKGYDANPIILDGDVALYDLNFVFFFDFVIADVDGFYVRSWDSPFIEIDKYDTGVPKIYKINYEGQIQKLYVLNQRIRSFTIKDNKLYAICLDPNEQEWVIYKGLLR